VIRIAPARAVPIDAPNCVAVFWSPPTSGLCSSGTAETVMAPSCDARQPNPNPISRSGTVTMPALASTSSAVIRTTIPITIAARPSSTTRRGEAAGKNFGIPAAARSIVIESGVILMPVSIAESPRATDR
jgi:hypothetical protein